MCACELESVCVRVYMWVGVCVCVCVLIDGKAISSIDLVQRAKHFCHFHF